MKAAIAHLVGAYNVSGANARGFVKAVTGDDDFLAEGIELLTATLATAGKHQPVEYAVIELPEGRERITEATVRTNQKYFRNSLLENYQRRCCLTGLNIPELLAASHIKPWSESDPKTERLAPANGLLLNAFHDRAFDRGFITIDQHFRIVVSPKVKHTDASDEMLWRYQGVEIELPKRMPPAREFIEYHNDCVFVA